VVAGVIALPDATERRREAVMEVLRDVLDPEVPALSVVDLGIVRAVELDAVGVPTVVVTPTYSGCPAVTVIERAIVDALELRGYAGARVRTTFSPAWTTDWIGEEAREKLRRYGIAPPSGRAAVAGPELVPLMRRLPTVACPFCGSAKTTLRSEFGSTACKAMLFCDACHQPFESFKSI
jgi:ring-1,2-phenylacetyl-CoA epoxidase subunit PaaD